MMVFTPFGNVDCLSGLFALAAIFFVFADMNICVRDSVSWKTLIKEAFFVVWSFWSVYVLINVGMVLSSLGMALFGFFCFMLFCKHSVDKLYS